MKNGKTSRSKTGGGSLKKNNWVANPDIEKILNQKGLAWKYVTVPLSKIDTVKSEVWNQRAGNVSPEHQQRYVRQMEDGHEFKAVAGYEDGGKIVLSDGRHRISACRDAGWTQVMVCLHDQLDVREIRSIAVLANETHGSPGSEDDIFGPAVDEVVNEGASQADVSRRYNLNPVRLSQRVKERRSKNDLQSKGIIPTKLSKSLQCAIVKIDNHKNMRLPKGTFSSAAAEIAKASPNKVSTNLVEDWGQQVLAGKTQADQMRGLEAGRKNLLKVLSRPQTRRSQKHVQFVRVCENLKRLHKTAKSVSDIGLTPEDIDRGRKEGYAAAFLWAAEVFKK